MSLKQRNCNDIPGSRDTNREDMAGPDGAPWHEEMLVC